MNEIHIKVPDMSCGHCVGAIEGALNELEGITSIEANLETKIVIIKSDNDLDPDSALASVTGVGYTPELMG